LLGLAGQAQGRTALSLNLGYFNNANGTQYLVANAKAKVNGRFQPRPAVPVSFFITGESPSNLLGKAVTNNKGEAVLYVPPSAREEWNKSTKQSFVAVVDSSSLFEQASADAQIIKAKIELDTAEDRTVVAKVMEQQEKGWEPVKGVDLILAVKRLGSNLNIGSTPTHTTDSTGKASVDFKLENLPGDDSGNLVLVARIEGSDQYGTVTQEKKVPWGIIPTGHVSEFNKRTLYSRRGLAPIWLGFMAYSISLTVWAILIYLLFQIRKMRRIGRESAA
jgi:hypothetical protein